MEWTTVQPHRRVKSWLSGSQCKAMERDLNIRNLARTLMSDEAKTLQQQRYVFFQVVKKEDLEVAKTIANAVLLPIHNKWHDHAMFQRLPECQQCGISTQPVLGEFCEECWCLRDAEGNESDE